MKKTYIAETAGGVILLVLMSFIVPTLFVFISIIIVAFVSVFAIVWMVGLPISIKQSGKEIGHVKWFTFYPRCNSNWNGD